MNTVAKTIINNLCDDLHFDNVDAGWYTDIKTGLPLERNIGEIIALIHSELSEALEACRKGLNDDKLPHRLGIEVELADAVIRIMDLCGYQKLDLGGAMLEKIAYNRQRADHKLQNRLKDGGKKF